MWARARMQGLKQGFSSSRSMTGPRHRSGDCICAARLCCIRHTLSAVDKHVCSQLPYGMLLHLWSPSTTVLVRARVLAAVRRAQPGRTCTCNSGPQLLPCYDNAIPILPKFQPRQRAFGDKVRYDTPPRGTKIVRCSHPRHNVPHAPPPLDKPLRAGLQRRSPPATR